MRAVLIALLSIAACAAPAKPAATPAAPNAPAELKMEMRAYVFVMLKRGPAWSAEETPESKKLFEGHMANIIAMGKAKKLVIAGPFDTPADDTRGYAGIFIMDVKDEAEARALLANDPAIAAGRLVPEYLSWYGPAGLTYKGATP